jgi:hypothetical protein
MTLLCNRKADRGRSLGGRGFSKRNFVIENSQKHSLASGAKKLRARSKTPRENPDIITDA